MELEPVFSLTQLLSENATAFLCYTRMHQHIALKLLLPNNRIQLFSDALLKFWAFVGARKPYHDKSPSGQRSEKSVVGQHRGSDGAADRPPQRTIRQRQRGLFSLRYQKRATQPQGASDIPRTCVVPRASW